MSFETDQLANEATRAARDGRWAEAEQLWRDVHARDPADMRALSSLAIHAMQRGDGEAARDLLQRAAEAQPTDLMAFLSLIKLLRDQRDARGELAAIDRALAADPYFLPGLLARGAWCERAGADAAAAMHYRNAARIAPPALPEPLAGQLAHARAFAERHDRAFHSHLDEALSPLLDALPAGAAGRWREAASIMAGRTRPYVQEANQLLVPRLPAMPFYDRAMFAWAAALEARTDAIRAEMLAALGGAHEEFRPYIALRPGQPVDQWAPLNHSTRWSHYALWRNGQPDAAHLAACPETRAALEAVDMAAIGGLCPNAMFSVLAPHSEIPPHTGETNARLVTHLPLVVPPGCSYRVGYEQRQWTEGELLVFDDTIEHTARNDSDQPRIVLIFDIWNPLLAQEERGVVQALTRAARAFGAAG